MKTQLLFIAARLSDQRLIARVERLARHEREATASLVACLSEFGARKLYLSPGCATLFTYCTEMLHLSEHDAYLRITAARLAGRFPIVLDKLESGAVNLTTLKLLRKVLTVENHVALLAAAEHKSKRQVEALVVSVAPRPAVKGSVRKLPAPQATRSTANAPATATTPTPLELGGVPTPADTPAASSAALGVGPAAEPVVERPVKPAVIEQLAPEHYKIQFTASAEMHAKLRRAQDLMRHQVPTGDPAAIFDRALTMLVSHLEKTRLGATDRPRPARPTRRRGSRHIPAGVRRAVWERDGGRCAFTSADGKRCSERGLFEFHHVQPHGDGGEPSLDNIELRCRAHNQYEADLYFGPSNDAVRRAAIEKRTRKDGNFRRQRNAGSVRLERLGSVRSSSVPIREDSVRTETITGRVRGGGSLGGGASAPIQNSAWTEFQVRHDGRRRRLRGAPSESSGRTARGPAVP